MIAEQFLSIMPYARPSSRSGSFRMRFPVARKIALVIAGAIVGVLASPMPPGGFVLGTVNDAALDLLDDDVGIDDVAAVHRTNTYEDSPSQETKISPALKKRTPRKSASKKQRHR